MSELHLLALAAKAAGLRVTGQYLGDDGVTWLEVEPRQENCGWNPRHDDGDAFRLAADLGILEWAGAELHQSRNKADTPRETARLAIVHRAAAIGEALP